MEVALEGVRILDLSQYLAGPFASMLLADLGAEVIKVEPIDLSPEVRKMPLPADRDPHGAGFIAVNRNKKSVSLNLRDPRGRKIFYDLVRVSDVVTDNFRAGVTKRLAVDHDALSEINPRIICCSLTAFGSNGPLAGSPAFDLVLQAQTGAMSISKDWPDHPQQINIAVADTGGGVYLAMSVLAALYRRERTGHGERVETSMLAGMMSMMLFDTAGMSIMGLEPKSMTAPYGSFRTKDGWLAIAAHRTFPALCHVLDLDELVTDERFGTIFQRAQHKKELNEILQAAFLTRNTDEWLSLLAAADVPCGRINTIKEALEHPQVAAEDLLVSFDYVLGGKATSIGNAIKLRSTPPEKREHYFSPPKVGQHTEEVLSTLLDYSADQIADLREQHVIRCD